MFKLLLAIAACIAVVYAAFIAIPALAAPTAQNFTNIQPFTTDTYDNGTSTPNLRWFHFFTKYASTTALTVSGQGTGCAQFNSLGFISSTGVACGSSGGASTTLLSDNNTFSGANIFTSAPKLGSLSGLIAGNAGVPYAVSTTSMNASITGNAGTVTNGVYTTDTGSVTNTMLAGSIANGKLTNSSITVNGTVFNLGDNKTITAASSTLLANANTFGGINTFSSAPIFSSLTGVLKGNGSSALTIASNGTDFTLITANTCGAGQFFNSATAAGVFGCGTPSGGGSAYPFYTFTNYGTTTHATGTPASLAEGAYASSSIIIASTTGPQLYLGGDGTGYFERAINSNLYIGTTSSSLGTSTVPALQINSADASTTLQRLTVANLIYAGNIYSAANIQALNVIAKGPNATFELYNTNDSVTKRGFFQTTYDSLQFGYGSDDGDSDRLYVGKEFLGGNSVIATTHRQDILDSTAFSNILDDGTANADVGLSSSTPTAQLSIFTGRDFGSHGLTELLDIGSSTRGTATSTLFNVLSSGNVGIGSTSPYARLSVFAGGDFASRPASTLFAIGSSSAGTATSTLFSVSSVGATVLGDPTFVSSSTFKGLVAFANQSPTLVTGAERVIFEDANGADSDWSYRVAANGFGTINFASSNGTLGTPTAIATNKTLGSLRGIAYNGTLYASTTKIDFITDGTPSSTSVPGAILFSTTKPGVLNVQTEALRIDSSQRVGIGTSSPAWLLDLASSTGPQLALSDSSLTSDMWTFRSIANSLYIATATHNAGYATTSNWSGLFDINGKFQLRDVLNAWTGVVSPTRTLILTTGTTTTWTGTTSAPYIPEAVMTFSGTLRSVQCHLDQSFLGIEIDKNGTAITPSYLVASSTVGTVALTGTFVSGDRISLKAGTTTSATTLSANCSLRVTETP